MVGAQRRAVHVGREQRARIVQAPPVPGESVAAETEEGDRARPVSLAGECEHIGDSRAPPLGHFGPSAERSSGGPGLVGREGEQFVVRECQSLLHLALDDQAVIGDIDGSRGRRAFPPESHRVHRALPSECGR